MEGGVTVSGGSRLLKTATPKTLMTMKKIFCDLAVIDVMEMMIMELESICLPIVRKSAKSETSCKAGMDPTANIVLILQSAS